MTKPITNLSRERLEQLADENTICKVSWDERIEMARALLAVMDAKPVAVTDEMAFSFHSSISDSAIGLDEADEIKAGLRAALANVTTPPAPSAPDGWIKCGDRMPAVKDFLWVYDGVEAVRAYYFESGNIFIRDNGDELYRVTYWMSLPAAPE